MKRHFLPVLALSAAALLGLSACGQSGTPEAGGGSAAAPEYEVAQDVDVSGSPVLEKAKKAGKINIGVKFDQPGLGNMPVGKDKPEGFDVEIAKMIAAKLGFSTDQINWTETVSANREPFIQNGKIDMLVATYTINPERKKVVDFAGPYYVTGQGFLVPADNEDIKGPDDVTGKKICSVDGSNSAQQIKEKNPKVNLVTYDTYSKCVTDLESGSVEAVTTDDAILRGYAAQYDGKFKTTSDLFTEEPYGIAMKHGDTTMRKAVNKALQESEDNGDWKKGFEHTLGDSSQVQIPSIEEY
jgi:glutamate transport system substrate-binding protein